MSTLSILQIYTTSLNQFSISTPHTDTSVWVHYLSYRYIPPGPRLNIKTVLSIYTTSLNQFSISTPHTGTSLWVNHLSYKYIPPVSINLVSRTKYQWLLMYHIGSENLSWHSKNLWPPGPDITAQSYRLPFLPRGHSYPGAQNSLGHSYPFRLFLPPRQYDQMAYSLSDFTLMWIFWMPRDYSNPILSLLTVINNIKPSPFLPLQSYFTPSPIRWYGPVGS